MVGTSVVKELSYSLPVQIYAINLNPIFSDTTLQYLQKAFTTFWKGSSWNFASIINPPCPDPDPGWREKNNSNISFMKYYEILNISKGFTKVLKAYIKPFQVSQRSVKPNLISILKQLSEMHGAWRVKGI